MENFSKTVKICPKRGQKFSRSAQKSLFISRKYVITRDDNVHQGPNQPFFSCSTEPSLSTRRNGGHDIRTFWRSHGTQHFKKLWPKIEHFYSQTMVEGCGIPLISFELRRRRTVRYFFIFADPLFSLFVRSVKWCKDWVNWGHGLKLHLAISSSYVVSQMGSVRVTPNHPPISFFPKSKIRPPPGGDEFPPKIWGGTPSPPAPPRKNPAFLLEKNVVLHLW